MKRLIILVIGLLLVLSLALFLSGPASAQAQKKSSKDLPAQYRKWLEEEVVYIITPKERDVFLQLDSDREREVFIKAFWKQRDPTPDTDKNEYREEHSRRIAFANQWLGRGFPGPGWRTDMGRIYILLGEPKTIDRFENLTQVFPTIIWFYDGMASLGLPNSFNVVFFKAEGTGNYVLYSPMKDGPQKLLNNYMGDPIDYESAYLQMMDIEPAIASVSLSLIPGESLLSPRPTMSSEILLGTRIPSAPFEKVKDEYAEKLLRYKDIIEVDYTANYIDSDALIRVYQDPGGFAFVHYLIEPKRLTFEPVEDRYHADLEADVSVTDPQGVVVYQFNRSVPFDMTESQLAAIRGKLFSFQDVFPLIPGSYKINILLKNRVSREFTSAEASLIIPAPGAFTLYAPALANRVDTASRYRGQTKPFLFGDLQLTPSPRNDFLPGETLYTFFQLQNAPEDVRNGGVVEYTILKETEKGPETVQTVTKTLAEYPDRTNIFEKFSLANWSPAYYILRISVQNAARAQRIAVEEHFLITALPSLMRPWVLSIPLPPSNAPQFSNIVGLQYMNKKDLAESRPLLEAAVRRDPNSASFALDYARLLLELKEYAGVKAAAQPFLADDRKWEFLEPAGRACQALGEHAEAIAYYKDYLAHFGANLNVLNAVGECYSQVGNIAEALAAWEHSLRIEPNQPKLKERVQELKQKK
ncbi:MAG: GWxTD domain-containing protein [Candidatus Aminicenantes bacterium]|nr:GWxTD domain-containing protein [Candidatus Aminicenantes bacterium]